jgi:hypothetical protein
MKASRALSLLFIVCSALGTTQEIKLESEIIKIADGSLINADKIEFIRKFRRTLLTFLLGEELPNGKKRGLYKLFDTYYNVKELATLEQEIADKKDEKSLKIKQALRELLVMVKADYIIKSKEFIDSGRGAKKVYVILIEEDCKKRNIPNSFLLDWARTKDGHESTMFEGQIKSFSNYYHFCTDLVNFLLDLTHSCPKAEQQFRERVAKWSKVKELFPVIAKKAHVKPESINEADFLKYLKERHLDQIALEDITPPVIEPLLIEYIKHPPAANAKH